MSSLAKLMLSSILITVIVLGLCHPVVAQPSATIYVDAPSPIPVSTEFDIIIWIRDITPGWGMIGFNIRVDWDPDDLEYIESEFLGDSRPGWGGAGGPSDPGEWGGGGSGNRWTEDAAWFRIRFHCLREGPAPITVSSPDTVILEDVTGQPFDVFPEPVTVTIYQGLGPVGGISTPVNKLGVLTPYLALAGLIAVVSTVYVIRRRKD